VPEKGKTRYTGRTLLEATGATAFDHAPPSGDSGRMQEFDSMFSNIVDYILRITCRIREGRQSAL
jgi:hypothetical protein